MHMKVSTCFVRSDPELVTLDLMMPDAPDFVSQDLFRLIRRESPQTAIIIVSVQRAGINASNFLGEGALGSYWEKSFINFDDVRRRLSYVFPDMKARTLHSPSGLAARIRGGVGQIPSHHQ